MTNEIDSASVSADLERLEGIVRRGQKTFIKVGNALAEIRDRKLYRSTHGTFAKYVEERFGFKRRNAYHLIDAAAAADNVQHVAQIENPRQAAEIAKAPAEVQSQVVERATEIASEQGKPVTSATIKAARQEVVSGDDNDACADDDAPPPGRALKRRPPKSKPEVEPAAPQSRGVGVQRAHDAIAKLKSIPRSDGLRSRAFEIVSDWIETNSSIAGNGGSRMGVLIDRITQEFESYEWRVIAEKLLLMAEDAEHGGADR